MPTNLDEIERLWLLGIADVEQLNRLAHWASPARARPIHLVARNVLRDPETLAIFLAGPNHENGAPE